MKMLQQETLSIFPPSHEWNVIRLFVSASSSLIAFEILQFYQPQET